MYDNYWAIREAHWKLLGDVGEGPSLALYNLTNDPGEQQNLATQNKDVTTYLLGRHNDWIRSIMQDAKANGYISP